MYRTLEIRIKKHSKLYNYSSDICYKSARLYNRANYIVRNYATAVTKFLRFKPLTDNELEVYTLVRTITDRSNRNLSHNKKWLTYNILDYVLKTLNDTDYYSVPSHVNQQTLRLLYTKRQQPKVFWHCSSGVMFGYIAYTIALFAIVRLFSL